MNLLMSGFAWELKSQVVDGVVTVSEFTAPHPTFGPNGVIHAKVTERPGNHRIDYHITY